jgi:general secretion pathway protein C
LLAWSLLMVQSMEALLRKRIWIIDGAALAVCALLMAQAVTTAVAAQLERFATNAPPWRHPPARFGPAARTLDRNIFCSRCTAAIASPGLSGPEKSSLPLVLIAVMRVPRWSLVLLKDTSDGSLGLLAPGGRVRDAIVTSIEETRVWLQRPGRREYLDLLEPSSGPSSRPAPPAVAPGGDPLAAELERGIRQTGDRSYEIQRSTLEALLGNMNALARSARVIPEVKDGKPAGLRLVSVRPDGPFARIGIQNGDLISSINGLELDSVEKSIVVYGKLRSATHLSVGLERGGGKVALEYTIR